MINSQVKNLAILTYNNMKLKDIVQALNTYYSNKFPNAKGWFIGNERTEPTKVGVYKKQVFEIFYHVPGKNTKVFHSQLIDRCPEGSEDLLRDKAMTALLSEIFMHIDELDKYETF